MRTEQVPGWVSPVTAVSPAALDHITSVQLPDAMHLAGTSKDGSLAWQARGPALEVVATSSGRRVVGWHFGAVVKDDGCEVAVIAEFSPDRGSKYLLVGVDTGSAMGMLCVLNIAKGRVVKAINMPYRVTAIETVTTESGEQAPAQILSEHLRCFCGVVAVGTLGGHVYLIDICMDDPDITDEVQPASLAILNPTQSDWGSCRYHYMQKHMHLCLELDVGDTHSQDYFYYRKPDCSLIKTFASDEVCVTSLLFVKHTGCIHVGFNFGCFQIWKAYVPMLEYSSRYEEDLYPVTHMAYQEPENDPRSFCYLWLARGPTLADQGSQMTSSITMYQLAYNKKTWYEGFGVLFQELLCVGPRLEHDLGTDPASGVTGRVTSSRVLTCYTLHNLNYKPPKLTEKEDSFEDGSHGLDLSLCLFVWEAESHGHSQPQVYLALFDLNRWYHAQMPHSVRTSGTHEVCPFIAFCSLEPVLEDVGSDAIMVSRLKAVHIDYNSIIKFQSNIRPPPEQHIYPSSLSFTASCILSRGIVIAKFIGLQKLVLLEMSHQGPAAMIDPDEIFNLCLSTGLLHRGSDLPAVGGHLAQKRLSLLTVSLENNQINFINKCIKHWANGEFAGVGCTLRTVLDWAWAKVGHIKSAADQLCLPLYDWSGQLMDSQAQHTLHSHVTSLGHMTSIFETLANQNIPTTDQGKVELDMKVEVVTLVHQHFQVALWFYTNGILPEKPASGSDSSAPGICYPYLALKDFYFKRRKEITGLHSELNTEGLLMIDSMLNEISEPIHALWEKEGGDGKYPPPNLHALMVSYLLETVPVYTKYLLTMYMLMDLAMHVPDNAREQFLQKAARFPSVFCHTPAIGKLAEGLWLLDHKDFQQALTVLMDPSLRDHLLPWQHRHVIKAFLYQGCHQMALCYIRVSNPPLVTAEDVRLKLTVLLANGLTSEALTYQQSCRDQVSIEDLLSHIFLACQQTGKVNRLLELPVNDTEESHLVSYLEKSTDLASQEMLVMYYLQRGRYVDAIRQNSKIKTGIMSETVQARDRAGTRNAIVERYRDILPAVQRRFFDGHGRILRKYSHVKREVARPKPLSAVVNRVQRTEAVSRAMLLSTVLDKVQEANQCQKDMTSPVSNWVEEKSVMEPFVGTPCTPRIRKRVSEVTELVYPTPQMEREIPRTSSFVTGESGNESMFNISLTKTLATMDSPKRRRLSKFMIHGSSALQLLRTPPTGHLCSRTYTEAKSMLQTPPVKRKSPARPKQTIEPARTPQSILKTRSLSRQVVTRTLGKEASFTPSQPSFSLHEAFPTPPPVQRVTRASTPKKPSGVQHEAEEALQDTDEELSDEEVTPTAEEPPHPATSSGSAPGTPKVLRFQIPSPVTDSSLDQTKNDSTTEEVSMQSSQEQIESPDLEVKKGANVPKEAEVPEVPDLIITERKVVSETSVETEARSVSESSVGEEKKVVLPRFSLSSSHTFTPSKLARSPLRNVRDRSPTPERKSPKMASRTDNLTPSPRRPIPRSPVDAEEEEVKVIDDDITFQFGKTSKDTDEEMMEADEDTEPAVSQPVVTETVEINDETEPISVEDSPVEMETEEEEIESEADLDRYADVMKSVEKRQVQSEQSDKTTNRRTTISDFLPDMDSFTRKPMESSFSRFQSKQTVTSVKKSFLLQESVITSSVERTEQTVCEAFENKREADSQMVQSDDGSEQKDDEEIIIAEDEGQEESDKTDVELIESDKESQSDNEPTKSNVTITDFLPDMDQEENEPEAPSFSKFQTARSFSSQFSFDVGKRTMSKEEQKSNLSQTGSSEVVIKLSQIEGVKSVIDSNEQNVTEKVTTESEMEMEVIPAEKSVSSEVAVDITNDKPVQQTRARSQSPSRRAKSPSRTTRGSSSARRVSESQDFAQTEKTVQVGTTTDEEKGGKEEEQTTKDAAEKQVDAPAPPSPSRTRGHSPSRRAKSPSRTTRKSTSSQRVSESAEDMESEEVPVAKDTVDSDADIIPPRSIRGSSPARVTKSSPRVTRRSLAGLRKLSESESEPAVVEEAKTDQTKDAEDQKDETQTVEMPGSSTDAAQDVMDIGEPSVIPITPPKSAESSRRQSSRRRSSLSSQPGTPTRRSSRLLQRDESPNVPSPIKEQPEPPSTPPRRGRRTSTSEASVMSSARAMRRTPTRKPRQVEENKQEVSLSPTRSTRSQKTAPKPAAAAEVEVPVSPSRSTRGRKSLAVVEEDQQEVESLSPPRSTRSQKTTSKSAAPAATEIEPPSSPSRSTRARKSLAVDVLPTVSEETAPTSPGRSTRSRKSSVSDAQPSVAEETAPASPTRVTRTRKSSVSEAASKVATPPTSPSRSTRSRKSLASETIPEEPTPPPSPSRSTRGRKSVASETVHEEPTPPPSPTRSTRGRKSVASEVPSTEPTPPSSPSRSTRSRKSVTSTSEVVEVAVKETKTRRSRASTSTVKKTETDSESADVVTANTSTRSRRSQKKSESEAVTKAPEPDTSEKVQEEAQTAAEEPAVADVTEEIAQSETAAETVPDDDAVFTFSEPMEIDAIKDKPQFQPTVPDFIFSPPLTRTKSHRLSLSQPLPGPSILFPEPPRDKPAKQEKAKPAKTSRKKPRTSRSQALDEVKVVTPPEGADSPAETVARRPSTRSTRSQSTSSNPTAKRGKRKLLKLW